MAENNKNKLVLIDGHSVLFRAYYAYPPLTTKEGELVNAVYGFTSILLGIIRELEPTHIAVSFDRAKPTFRHKEFKKYKAHRKETPTELIDQLGRVEEVVTALNIPIFAVEGFEADDVIGTLARQATLKRKRESVEVIIATGDQDAFQLVDSNQVGVYTPSRGKNPGKIWDEKAVEEKFGLTPTQIIDYKALAGDSSDGIPGVRGIGPKTATKLLQEYKTMGGVYENIDKIEEKFAKSVYQKLIDGEDSAKMSKMLATIVTDVPIKLSLNACVVHDFNKEKTIKLFSELEFDTLIKKLPHDSFEQMVEEEMF